MIDDIGAWLKKARTDAGMTQTALAGMLDGITAADVAARFKGSRRLAEIEFRRATGRSILEEILRVRFERVELLLRDQSRAVGAIAGLCGWRSENALRAAFRKRHGCSMRTWRKRGLRDVF